MIYHVHSYEYLLFGRIPSIDAYQYRKSTSIIET